MVLVSFTLFTDLALLSMSRKPCKITFGHALMLCSFIVLNYSIWSMQKYLRSFNNTTFAAPSLRIFDFMNFIGLGDGRDYIKIFSGAFFANWLYVLYAIRVF